VLDVVMLSLLCLSMIPLTYDVEEASVILIIQKLL